MQAFISYAHVDIERLASLCAALKPTVNLLQLTIWDDGELRAGDTWKSEIQTAVDASSVFIVLVTIPFLSSDFIMQHELPAIRMACQRRGALLIPVIASDCDWELEFPDVQSIPHDLNRRLVPLSEWNDRDRGLAAAARQIRTAVNRYLGGRPPSAEPVPGPTFMPTRSGFAPRNHRPPAVERRDPRQLARHKALSGQLSSCNDFATTISNTHRRLRSSLQIYSDNLGENPDETNIAGLDSAGGLLRNQISALDSREYLTENPALDPSLRAVLDNIVSDHDKYMEGFAEGRAYRASAIRSMAVRDPVRLRERTDVVLAAMRAEQTLLTDESRQMVDVAREGLVAGRSTAELLSSAAALGANALSAFADAVDPDIALPANSGIARFANNPNRATLESAAEFLTSKEQDIGGFVAATENQALARRVAWSAARGRGAPVAETVDTPVPDHAEPAEVPAPGSMRNDLLFTSLDTGPEMVWIPDGGFVMGASDLEISMGGSTSNFDMGAPVRNKIREEGVTFLAIARPQVSVRIERGFWLSRYPVTVSEYRHFVDSTRYGKEREWEVPGFPQDDRHPVVNVSWSDASAYLRWLSEETGEDYRFPSEAEWEYAARAHTTTARYWGDDWGDGDRFSNAGQRIRGTTVVGSLAGNQFGLHDMLGNVWEWAADNWTFDLRNRPVDGSPMLENEAGQKSLVIERNDLRRVVRGGSWNSGRMDVRAANRVRRDRIFRSNSIGFRVARSE